MGHVSRANVYVCLYEVNKSKPIYNGEERETEANYGEYDADLGLRSNADDMVC